MQSLSETRRTFLATLGAALPAFAASKNRQVTAPPNIVLVLADELPSTMLGCYGNRELKTPNIDALARRGVRFQNAFAAGKGGATGRATLLSGRTPMQPAAADEVILTDLLSTKGYDVGYVGAWGLGNDKQPGHGIRWAYTIAGDQMFWNGEPVQEAGDRSAILTRRGVQFLGEQKTGSNPFFLAVTYPGSTSAAVLDSQLPLLIGKLRERNLEENTMIVFTSTGGSPELLRVPLIYCWPGHAPVEANRPGMVASYDLLFTVSAAANLTPASANLCGRSYLPLVTGKPFPKKTPWRTMVYGSFGNADTASDNRFRLVIRDEGKGLNQLYDVRSDPRQSINQYTNRAFVTTRDQLRRNLNQWKTRYSH